MAGILMLGEGGGTLLPLLGAALCGLSVGAEVDLMAFSSAAIRVRAYGKVYGDVLLLAAGNGVGPFIAASAITALAPTSRP